MAPPTLLQLVPDAPQELRDILDGARGPLQAPIRSEIFGPQRFAQHGRSLGATHRAARANARAASFFPRIRENIRALREAHHYIITQVRVGYDISPAAEWLIDNFHLIETQVSEIHKGLPRGYFRTLPILQDEPLAGLPRVYGIAWALVAHTDSAVDEDLYVEFLGAYQETRELNLSELWALPTTLRVVLIENLRRLAERVASNKASREMANLCCDRIDSFTTEQLDQLLAVMNRRAVGRVFLVQMALRLSDAPASTQAGSAGRYMQWLQMALPDLAAAQIQQPLDQAADNLSMSNAVKALQAIGEVEWAEIIGKSSPLMRLMLKLPLFEAEDSATRNRTLHDIERLAIKSHHREIDIAQTLLDLIGATPDPDSPGAVANHWLCGDGKPQLMARLRRRAQGSTHWPPDMQTLALPIYLSVVLGGTLAIVAWILLHHGLGVPVAPFGLMETLLVATLMLFPASEAVVAVTNRVISESARPVFLPRLELTGGLAAEHRVMVVIPGLLGSSADAKNLAHRLLLHYLANPERHAQFALLTDWVDCATVSLPSDIALLDETTRLLAELNARYPVAPGAPGDSGAPVAPDADPRFILLHRNRTFSQTEQAWIGWERKRGKLEQLVHALATGDTSAFLDLGLASRISADTRYILTLDSDTRLPPGRLRELVSVAAHPQNRPRLDASGRRVISGYGIFQPRVVTPLPAAGTVTLFHWLFSGQLGIDAYSAAASEVYQDIFGEGTFTGKGLLDVRTLHRVLADRLPTGQILSHDLLEGALARCAAVTDITVIEDAPFHPDVAASRMHRWMRGDWQLLPILARTRLYPMCGINRWKMIDNLRRSLVPPLSLVLLVLSLDGHLLSPWAALLLVMAAFSAGPVLGAIAGFSPSRDDLARVFFYRLAALDLARAVSGGLWWLAQLLQQALLSSDAIVRAVYRMLISRRKLLQWLPAAAAEAKSSLNLAVLTRRHAIVPAVAVLIFLALLADSTDYPYLSALLCLGWAASPVWTWWFSKPGLGDKTRELTDDDRNYLTGIARDSWSLFERCVGAADHHLPPDNLQTLPYDIVAHRTSPTNIGLYLLSSACACEFGWITPAQMASRLEDTLTTLFSMQRHQGHFLNWYDTETLAPLSPMYVSTVDSGNLCGHLLAVAQACLRLADRLDTSLGGLQSRLLAVAKDCHQLAWQPDFSFLYSAKRHLLHIGYQVSEQKLDASFYDLLASEAHLTSLLAIAKGDVPVRHWAALGRPLFALGTEAGLRSWSGSMFEYLMPGLILDAPQGSVLQSAGQVALAEQIAYGALQKVPWGVSESAYAARDNTLAYQYAPHGVPHLALRRTPVDELVVAPYATALAAQLSPHQATGNFRAVQAIGGRGDYGFLDALDFSPARQTAANACTPVATFMAHHQGMSIVALANTLLDGVAQRWGMADPHLEAVSSLLHERVPREIPVRPNTGEGASALNFQNRAPGLLRDVLPGAHAIEPTHVMSNGRYSVTVRSNGAGWSRWGSAGITRWRDDALRDTSGAFIYLRRSNGDGAIATAGGSAPVYSLTHHPAPDPNATYKSVFHADRVCFLTEWADLQSAMTVWVSPEDDIEFRQVELRNTSDAVIELELMSAFDITLAEPRSDEAHPAFSNMFVSADWLPGVQALLFERKARLPTERGLYAAHFLVDAPRPSGDLSIQTDRQRWMGRNHPDNRPAAGMDPAPSLVGATALVDGTAPAVPLATGLDPVCALGLKLQVGPQATVQVTFATVACDELATLHAVVDKYKRPINVQRASLMSATLTGIRMRTLALGSGNFAGIQTITTALVCSLAHPQVHALRFDGAAAEICDKRLLWRFGISGDRPIVLVSAGRAPSMGLLRTLVKALRLWSWGGIACDLVILNAEPASYLMAMQREITALRDAHMAASAAQPGLACTAMHVLRTSELSGDERSTLQRLARLHFSDDGRPLLHHLQDWISLHQAAFEQRHAGSRSATGTQGGSRSPVKPAKGAFSMPDGEYRFAVGAGDRPLRPWVNVIANPQFGAQLSEAGGGYTWAVNSRLNQLTAWSNDPVADPPAEWFLLQDLRSKETWSLAANAWGAEEATYEVAHGQGYSHIRHRRGELLITATWCVDPHSNVKQIRVQIVNEGSRSARLRLVGLVEWMMGDNRLARRTVSTGMVPLGSDARFQPSLLCTQDEQSGGFGNGTAFFSLLGPPPEKIDWTCDRREFFDARGTLVLPDHFGQQKGDGLDPCAALSAPLDIAAGGSDERVFLIGYAHTADAAAQLAMAAAKVPAKHRLDAVRAHWNHLLGATVVVTPDPLFDAMVNRWLLYQTTVCRLWAKSGFYQAGGATGFRDQLQDAMATVWADPSLLRSQILLCASRQFAEGDVQHWWHAPQGAGVRTRFSDDLLWLPHALALYLKATGDLALADETVAFIEGPQIAPGSEDAYYIPAVSSEQASVYEHSARAIDRSLAVGSHGLPLMGSGDWNDGMNRVGIEGRGESVWLGWFLCDLVRSFAPLARTRGDLARAQKWEHAAMGWTTALMDAGWDGQWFRRAYFDNGQPLGSAANNEGRIDLIAQVWAVLSGTAPASLQRISLAALEEKLVDRAAGLIRLIDPPLVNALPGAGYIQAYPPGVRENGSQYSHAGVWALMAQARYAVENPQSGADPDTPFRYFTYLSPAHRADHPVRGPVYGLEPYVVAGDIYSYPPYTGRGGWSWYTGAAAWLHRAAIESIFGLQQDATTLCFRPCLPSHWPTAELTLRRAEVSLRFILARANAAAALAGTAQWQARLLPVGQQLPWSTLTTSCVFVIPLVPEDQPRVEPLAKLAT